MPDLSLSFRSIGATHVGCVRSCNEDSMLERTDVGLWAVSDGMGGHLAGDVASAFVIQALRDVARPAPGRSFAASVSGALGGANAELHRRTSGSGATMGATVTVLGADADSFFCLWAGDSRLYRFAKGRLTQLTRDHRYIQALLDAGLLDPKEAENHPRRNVITRAVGTGAELELDLCQGPIAAGDVFLLVTDGVTAVLRDEDLAEILAQYKLEQAVRMIVERCLARGAPDNLSLIVVERLPAQK
jgi:serine/threonine-protein phosphatase Stp1